MTYRAALSDHYVAHLDDFERTLDNIDPAWAKAALYFRSHTDQHFGHGAMERRGQSLLDIHRTLEGRRRRYEAGDDVELLHAIQLCADENLPLPQWLATAFRARFSAFLKPGGPPSLDAALGGPSMPTGTPAQAERRRRDWQQGVRLYRAIHEVAHEHGSLDSALTAALASGRWGMGKRKAREIVVQIDNLQKELHGDQVQGFSQIWTKRGKQV